MKYMIQNLTVVLMVSVHFSFSNFIEVLIWFIDLKKKQIIIVLSILSTNPNLFCFGRIVHLQFSIRVANMLIKLLFIYLKLLIKLNLS